jgi:hypothetical protein
MSRVLINHFSAAFEAAYRTDPFHAFRKNLDSATPEEWDVRPSDWSRDEFGDHPELTICDLAFHVGGGLVMYANRAFGDATMGWGDIATAQSREKAMVLAWLDEVQAAFAAGLADRLDVVFGLDGWPHPQGVVPAHQTLGAAAYYQRLFAKLKDERPASAAPAFVLDRGRMLPYSDESDRFDNRYLAKVPDSAQLKALGVKQVFYVSEDGYVEADDLNEDFLAYSSAGLELRLIKPEDFGPDPTEPAAAPPSDGGAPRASDGGAGGSGSSYGYGYDGSHYYYGSRSYSHWYFWSYHGWGTPTRSYRPFTGSMLRSRYTPSARTTNYRGVGTGMSKSRPSGFGTIGIVSSGSGSSRRTVGTTRSGSWGRSSGTSGS